MFTGDLQVSSIGSTVGYVVALIPNKHWVIMGIKNPDTSAWDMLQVGSVSDSLATAIREHLGSPNAFALICISPTQLTWLARKTASKGCVAMPTSKLSVNVSAPLFVPVCSFANNVQFVHYLRIDVPIRVVFKDAPTGKYVTIYGPGYNALNVWLSDIMTEAMFLTACGTSVVITSIVCQKSGALLLRSTSGTTMIGDPALLPRGLVFDVVPVVATSMDGFVDCFVPQSQQVEQQNVCTPPRKVDTAAHPGFSVAPPTPPSAHQTPLKSTPTLPRGFDGQPRERER